MSLINKKNVSIFFSGVFTLIIAFILFSKLANHLSSEDLVVGIFFWYFIYFALFILTIIFLFGLISILKNEDRNKVRVIFFLTGCGFSSLILNILIHLTDIL